MLRYHHCVGTYEMRGVNYSHNNAVGVTCVVFFPVLWERAGLLRLAPLAISVDMSRIALTFVTLHVLCHEWFVTPVTCESQW